MSATAPHGSSQGNTFAHVVHPNAPVVLTNGVVTSVERSIGGHWDQDKGPPAGLAVLYTVTDEVSVSTLTLEAGIKLLDGTFVSQGAFQAVTQNGSYIDYWGDTDTVEVYDAVAGVGSHVKHPLSRSSTLLLALTAPAGSHSFTITELVIEWWY